MMLTFEAWKRNYKSEYDNYHSSPEQIARRAGRVQSRRDAVRLGIIDKDDGRDIHHVNGDPTDRSPKNLKPMNKSKNRSRKT